MEWKSWVFSHPTKEFLGNPELQRKYRNKYKQLKKFRSEIIEAALDIENYLNTVILHFLVGQDYPRHKLLRMFVFDADFCTFMQKRKILSQILKTFPDSFDFFKPEESKKLRRDINDLVKERNIFAHGNIFIDTRTGSAMIEYYQGGIQKEKIEENRMNAILEKCMSIERKLGKLN
jgi:hypothetical protein